MRLIFIILFLGLIPINSYGKPLDGYKDLKFGSPLKTVEEEKLNCPNLQEIKLDVYPKEFKSYICYSLVRREAKNCKNHNA